uniref:Transmembrane protein n=1 Tax=Mesocestoides corti TaxID=53468 RepID=A0A5K3FAW3_MESCO
MRQYQTRSKTQLSNPCSGHSTSPRRRPSQSSCQSPKKTPQGVQTTSPDADASRNSKKKSAFAVCVAKTRQICAYVFAGTIVLSMWFLFEGNFMNLSLTK